VSWPNAVVAHLRKTRTYPTSVGNSPSSVKDSSPAGFSGISVKSRSHVAVYAAAVDEPVVVKVVPDEPEAQVVCGLLRSAGIECGYRDTEAIESSLEDFTAAGPREIFVHQSDLETARALLGAGEG
jgi:hypothetical protein